MTATIRACDLSFNDVSVTYRGVPVLDGVGASIRSGEFIAVIGPNGAGKSSLLKAIVGVVDHGGTISVSNRGEAITDHRRRSQHIAYVPQQPVFPFGMSVAEYVLLGRTAHLSWLGVESRGDRLLASAALERLNLEGFAGRELHELSGGEAQRVSLARALVHEAPILILDEPTSALDLGHQLAVLDLIDELRIERGLTVITALHDLTSAARYADRVMLLDQGKIAEFGPPQAVITEPILSRHYGATIGVLHAPDGSLVVVPMPTPNVDAGRQAS